MKYKSILVITLLAFYCLILIACGVPENDPDYDDYYLNEANRKKDPAICEKISNESGEKFCASIFSDDLELCNEISNPDLHNRCKYNIAKNTDNAQICFDFEDRLIQLECLERSFLIADSEKISVEFITGNGFDSVNKANINQMFSLSGSISKVNGPHYIELIKMSNKCHFEENILDENYVNKQRDLVQFFNTKAGHSFTMADFYCDSPGRYDFVVFMLDANNKTIGYDSAQIGIN
jgi:phosphoribosyl-ATP pyrophosphohydrolase